MLIKFIDDFIYKDQFRLRFMHFFCQSGEACYFMDIHYIPVGVATSNITRLDLFVLYCDSS
jgi:hypothetical protein